MTSGLGRRAALAALACGLAGAVLTVSAADPPVRTYLDETTAATVTVATEPLVFARERTDLAVNARDYLSLAPIEVNRAGTRTYYWFGYVWSTIDRRDGEAIADRDDEWVLLADDRPIPLRPERQSLRELGIAELPLRRPVRTAVPLLFGTQPEILTFVAGASSFNAQLLRDGLSEHFPPWHEARTALRNFVDHLGLERR